MYKGDQTFSWVVPLVFCETRNTPSEKICPCSNGEKGKNRDRGPPELRNGKNIENTMVLKPRRGNPESV